MKQLLRFAGSLLLAGWLTLPTAQAGNKADTSLTTSKQRYSYAVGMQIGAQVQQITDTMDMNAFLLGLQNYLDKKPSLLTPEQINQAKADFREVVQKEVEQKTKATAADNHKKGEAFLKANKAKKEIHTTASGLQYQILTAGSGPKPKATDHVKVHYHGTLLDGTVFDSSVARKEPVTLPLDRVIPGWTEGVQLMPVGGKYRLFVPSKLAYGDKGAPPKIEPGSTLIFEVELLEIVQK